MKTINIKLHTCTMLPTLAHPQAEPGLVGEVSTYRIINVPDDVPAAQVLHLFDHTIIPFPDKLPTPYTVAYSQLGMGKRVEGGACIRADQVTPGLVFRVPQYPGVGVRTCQTSHLRKVGGDTTVVINCGVGVSTLELSPSDELEIIGDAA